MAFGWCMLPIEVLSGSADMAAIPNPTPSAPAAASSTSPKSGLLLLCSTRARGEEPTGRSLDSFERAGERTAPAVVFEADGVRARW